MKLRRLELQAFGHFSGHRLEFAKEGYGFHLVYGPNEAGKSTTLRAVRGLLFGIPQFSVDTFEHEGKNLRLAGEVCAFQPGHETASGGELCLSFVRRKGRKNTLLSEAGAPLDEQALRPFLGGADLSLFNAMFGLDHESLREGAQALLSGDGRVGESLFGASVGTGSIRSVLLDLRAEADQLFTAKGRSGKRISQGILDVRGARQRVLLSSTTASAYLAQQAKLSSVNDEIEQMKQFRAASRVQKERLERQLRVLPLLARRDSLLGQVAELGALPELPSDVKERRERAVALLEENRQKVEFEQSEVQRLQLRLDGLQVNEELVALDDALISEFSQRLGQYRKARLDLPKREGELAQKQDDVRELLKSLGHEPDLLAAEQLRLTRGEEAQLRRLSRERTAYDATLQDRAGKLKEAQSHAATRRKELLQLPEARSARGLASALKRAHSRVGLALRASEVHARAELFTPQLETAFTTLGSLMANRRDVLQLTPPPRSQLNAMAEQWASAVAALEKCHEQASALAAREVALKREIDELQARGEVPTSEGLGSLRDARDLRAAEHQKSLQATRLSPSAELAAEAESTWVQYQRAQVRADHYVDQLRSAAAQAAKLAVLRAAMSEVLGNKGVVQVEKLRLEGVCQEILAAHRELWSDVITNPLGPAEMLSWLESREHVVSLAEQQRQMREEAKTLDLQVAQALDDLSQELVRLGEPGRMMWQTLPQLVEQAEAVCDDIRRANEKRRELEQRLEHERSQVAEQEAALGELKEAAKERRAQWQKALKDLGLPRDAGPEEVNAMLDGLGELSHRLEEMRGLGRRIAGMRRDSEQLSVEVKKVLRQVLPAALDLDLDAGTESLVRQYRRGSEDAKEQRRVADELRVRSANIERFQARVVRAEQELAQLQKLAGVSDVSELMVVERKLSTLAQLQRQLADNDVDVLAQGEGLGLAEMRAEARATSTERNRQLLSDLAPEIEVAEKRLEALLNERASLEQSLSQLEGGASQAAEELAATVASLQHDVQQYVRLRMAEQILTQEVELYRAAHQGPVLRAASEMFPRLTLGRYQRLEVGYDKKDEQVLLCVRPDGREVPVSGLSDGTRDQLYLSLRLATLERYLEHHAALPLVLDDILIHFDDDRARAALSVLGELSRRTQVLFFTHHRRLMELALQAVPEAQLSLHELPTLGNSAATDEFSSLAG